MFSWLLFVCLFFAPQITEAAHNSEGLIVTNCNITNCNVFTSKFFFFFFTSLFKVKDQLMRCIQISGIQVKPQKSKPTSSLKHKAASCGQKPQGSLQIFACSFILGYHNTVPTRISHLKNSYQQDIGIKPDHVP